MIDPVYLQDIETPCYVCDRLRLQHNLEIFKKIQSQAPVTILLALKGYAMWSTFDQIRPVLGGCAASGLHEALLANEHFGKEVHTYSPAFKASEIRQIAAISDHIVFNSPQQLMRFHDICRQQRADIQLSLRINPQTSSAPVDLYNPCGIYSRLGTTLENFDETILDKLDGLHFHALCEQQLDALEQVLSAVEKDFGRYFTKIQSINLGGGHHITRKGYDVEGLIDLLKHFHQRYPHLKIYMEPGEAVGWETGVLVSQVLDIIHNKMDIAILDSSAEAHMPDTLAMPYRAAVSGAAEPGEKAYTYRLAGNTCLAGDIMGDYSFDEPLKTGDRIIFEDQIHYTFVKNTTFNGIALPSLAILDEERKIQIVKRFDYSDYRNRLS